MKLRNFIFILMVLPISGCANRQAEKSPISAVFDIKLSHACFEESGDVSTKGERHYLCAFEMSRTSDYSGQQKRKQAVSKFMERLQGNCSISRQWEMIDAKNYVT